jgi:hypothetical protein
MSSCDVASSWSLGRAQRVFLLSVAVFGRWKDTALRLRREAVEEARRANTLREQKLDEREHKVGRCWLNR